MERIFIFIFWAALVLTLVGCANISKPYITETDRVDQEVSVGNKGYLQGNPPEKVTRNLKRQWVTFDVDLPQIQGKPTEETKLIAGGKPVDVMPPIVTEETK